MGEGRTSVRKMIFDEMIIEYRGHKGELVITARGVSVQTEHAVDRG